MDYVYPKRPEKFFFKYQDVMFDERPAEDVSAAGLALLWLVLVAEDRRRFRGPAMFTNDMLCERLGLNSEDALDKVRKKAIAAGWLGYIPGGRGRRGQYWVLVPARCQDDDWEGRSSSITSPSGPPSLPFGPLQSGPIADQTADQSPGNSRFGPLQSGPITDQTADPLSSSSLLPKSPPPKTADGGGRERLTLTNPDHAALVDAVAAVTAHDPTTDGGAVYDAAAILLNAAMPYTPDEVREFGRRWKEFCQYSSARGRTHPYPTEVAKHTARVRAPRNRLAGLTTVPPAKTPAPAQEIDPESQEVKQRLLAEMRLRFCVPTAFTQPADGSPRSDYLELMRIAKAEARQ